MINRPFRDFDWELRSCGRHGHVTYRPTEPDLARRLHARTPAGEAWRCLRCELFVPGEPLGSGAADDAPIVLRGRALKDAFILRLIAVERFVRGCLLVALSYGIVAFEGSRNALQRVFDSYLPLVRPIAHRLGLDLQSAAPVRLVEELLHTSHATLLWVAAGVGGYALLQFAEGIGLWLLRRWGEYVAAVGTSAFIPLEIYEINAEPTGLKLAALVINIFLVVYLLWTKRLFGIRGGRAAHEAERHSASLLEVERAAQSA